jgi:plasmid stabilization system protein ParE
VNGCRAINITDAAQDDLLAGFWFYEQQQLGLGTYFIDSLISDIDSLMVYAGVHQQTNDVYRSLGSRFPYAIYYLLQAETATVIAVLDTRRDPVWLRSKVASR